MNYVLSYTLFALMIFLKKYECMEIYKQQIKVTRVITHYANPKYVQGWTNSIIKKNDTYNNVEARYTAIEDFPENLRLISMVYVTNSNYENATLLLHDDTTFVTDAPNFNFIPPVLTGSGVHYNKKGQIVLDDMAQLRFELIIPNLEKKGKYYKTDYMLIAPKDSIIIITFYSEWGFLKH